MKSVICIVPITGFDPSQTNVHIIYEQFHLLTDKNLAYNKESILRRLVDQTFADQMGITSVTELLNSSLWCLELPISENDEMPNLLDFGALMCDVINQLNTSLWFIRDNNVNIKACYIRINDTEKTNQSNCTVLRPALLSNTVNRQINDITFTTEEWSRAADIAMKINELMKHNSENPSPENHLDLPEANYNANLFIGNAGHFDYHQTNRIERAFKFIHSARTTMDTLLKIALYINAYECLFTTDSNEISHKIAERVAYYAATDQEQRRKTYKLMKEAYTVRSNYFHGKASDKKQTLAKLIDLLERLDTLTRQVLTKAIIQDAEIFLAKDIEPYFTGLLFS
ncbi:hypothetical protein SAMN05216490_3855 [Mucilaginibacter mallensis]|uniref:Uncharacterized protein n=1 Tax=Mucilaginibacter mallensis TaxID=652787 RepID=A0A1H2B1B5_MUCMA|nr:HEPN domain-containing protein [Mucilaginibacter mallensis]SDT52070.1 hypothetical protein SAMN05216490_3855 [Mucilaginibacter mallensis]